MAQSLLGTTRVPVMHPGFDLPRTAGRTAHRGPSLFAAARRKSDALTVQDATAQLRGPCRLSAVATAPSETATLAEASPELKATYSKLQNGSDVRGVAIEGVEGESVTLTPAVAYFIGAGFADWLAERLSVPLTSLRVALGRDPRLSGPLLEGALVAGLASRGVSVARFGLATTPAMFMSCITPGYSYDGAIMITASHLPFNRNGFKFFTTDGGAEKADITAVLAAAASAAAGATLETSNPVADVAHVVSEALAVDPALVSEVDFMSEYASQLREVIKTGVNHPKHYDEPLRGFKIVVDAGNGGGGYFAHDVLEPLGADTSGSQFLEPDGWFPNHIPNPEDKAAMAAGVQAVQRANADLGIVFDTDVDRSAVVASTGQPINSNRYIALMASIALRKYPGTTIVTDSVTSNGLTTFISELGGRHFRYRRGYKNVIGKGVELNAAGVDTQLMMETSGHGAMAENYYLDDGAYSAVQIVVELVKRRLEGTGDIATDLLARLKEPLDAREFRLKLLTPEFKEEGDRILEAFRGFAEAQEGWQLESENWEGWRVAVEEGEGRRGWLLLRASLHDPLLVLNVESEVEGGTAASVEKVLAFFSANPDFKVDASKLK